MLPTVDSMRQFLKHIPEKLLYSITLRPLSKNRTQITGWGIVQAGG